MQYQQVINFNDNSVRTDCIQRINDDSSISLIPNNMDNNDWVAYQAWVAAGNAPQAPSES